MSVRCETFRFIGPLLVDGRTVTGGDDNCRIHGTVEENDLALQAGLTIQAASKTSGIAPLEQGFSLALSGASGGDSFYLYGIGPTGLIVEIDCEWERPLRGNDLRMPDGREPSSNATTAIELRGGPFSMRIDVDGYREDFPATLESRFLRGGNQRCTVQGPLTHAGPQIQGSLTIFCRPGTIRNRNIKGVFSIEMAGIDSGEAISLLGVGPLGLIVELTATRHS